MEMEMDCHMERKLQYFEVGKKRREKNERRDEEEEEAMEEA